MRHRRRLHKLGRNAPQRKALLRNLARGLVRNGSIKTTESRAKALRPFLEPLITKACKIQFKPGRAGRVHLFRLLISRLGDLESATILVRILGPMFFDRPGGYLRIIKIGRRRSDSAKMAIIQLVQDEKESTEENLKSAYKLRLKKELKTFNAAGVDHFKGLSRHDRLNKSPEIVSLNVETKAKSQTIYVTIRIPPANSADRSESVAYLEFRESAGRYLKNIKYDGKICTKITDCILMASNDCGDPLTTNISYAIDLPKSNQIGVILIRRGDGAICANHRIPNS